MNDITKYVRPILAVGSLCALIWFYTLVVFGNEVPPEINYFWGPVSWWFAERTIGHIKERENGK